MIRSGAMPTNPLDNLLDKIRNCRICIDNPQGPPLPHPPRPVLRPSQTAKICVCGQAPGTRVHASGTPFMDPSGKRLRAWMGVTREQFYDNSKIAIVPMGFCFPGLDAKGGDLPPRKECAKAWRKQLFALMPQLELILLVGFYAQKWHLGDQAERNLTETVRQWRRYACATVEGPAYLPLPHPSWRNNGWLRKNDWFENTVIPYLQQQVRQLMA